VLCSIGVSSRSARGAQVGFDMIASWTPAVTRGGGSLPGRTRLAASNPPPRRRQSWGQLFLQADMRELSLHEIEFVSDHCEADVRLIEIMQFRRVSAWRKLFDRGNELTIILLGIHC